MDNRQHRTRRTPEQIRGILAEQRASGLSVRGFALRRRIPVTTLTNWSRRYSPSHPPGLVPLRVREFEDARPDPLRPITLRVELPGGAAIVIDGAPGAGDVRSLLVELGLL